MRDLAMLMAFFSLLVPAFKKPFIAVSLWLWTAMMFPNGWVYGIAQSMRYNLVFSIVTIGGMLVFKHRPKAEADALTILITLFLISTTISYLVGIGNPDVMQDQWIKFLKIVALYYCTVGILTEKNHIDFFIWCILLSVGFFAAVEGLKVIASGGGHHVEGMGGHILSDRNDLALAINMCIPLTIYMHSQNQVKLIKSGLLGMTVLMVLCVLGTYSRGGLLGLLVLGFAYFKESNNKSLSLLLIIIVIFLGSHLMSDEWTKRMDTIGNADQDNSFMTRVIAWKVSTLLALDHPLFGGGFNAIGYTPVWVSYALQLNDRLTFISTPPPNFDHGWAAHSLFFQVLGDQGFIGLFLFSAILLVAYRKLVKSTHKCEKQSAYYTLAKMLKLTLIMYVVNGLALSKVYFDLSFAILALIRVLEREVGRVENYAHYKS